MQHLKSGTLDTDVQVTLIATHKLTNRRYIVTLHIMHHCSIIWELDSL